MLRAGRIVLQLVLCVGAMCASASAYYYYEAYPSASAPFTPMVDKFDLTALNNNTVLYFVSDQGPSTLAQGDSYQAVLGEVRAAADVWNSVSSSQLRLAYGGVYHSGASEQSPGIDVEFSGDIPPGLLAYTKVFTSQNPASQNAASGNNGFFPITRSRVMLEQDLSQLPSWSELFFVTVVHEFGHSFGLQHTISSCVMSTRVTSGTSKAHPLATDDIAGFSLLYPAPKYLASIGSISGQVTLPDGTGVNLASVVAISGSNEPVSTMTNPDGTYEINGVPPGIYYVYVQPLPPPEEGESTNLNIQYPYDPDGNPIAPSSFFYTQFYPGTRDWTQAGTVQVSAKQTQYNVNFTVNQRKDLEVYAVRTYGFVPNGTPQPIAVAAPPFFVGANRETLVVSGSGLVQDNSPISGLTPVVLGYAAQYLYGSMRTYPLPNPYDYLAIDFQVSNTTGSGLKHLLFNTPDDMYVLPDAFRVVTAPPPSIDRIDRFANRAVAITGSQLSKDTRVLFDGQPGVFSGFFQDGRMMVIAPPGPAGYTATVVALNPDGQSSLYLSPNPPTYTYASGTIPSLTVSQALLTPATETTFDIVGTNTNFTDGLTYVGVGTSDVQVRQLTVVSPTQLTVTVYVPPNLNNLNATSVNVTTGLEIIARQFGYSVQVAPPPSNPPSASPVNPPAPHRPGL